MVEFEVGMKVVWRDDSPVFKNALRWNNCGSGYVIEAINRAKRTVFLKDNLGRADWFRASAFKIAGNATSQLRFVFEREKEK